jgi:surface carbohydrate biosynthesis protein
MENRHSQRTNGDARPGKNVIILVDSKTRDLDVATLIAHHLAARGVACHLEPLEAFRAVLAAHRPDMIIFNHLMASHLVAWSRRLAEMGVLTAVLPNEGIFYDREQLEYYAGRHHNGAHIDYFFCWNDVHRRAILAQNPQSATKVEVVGVPRFDFYFEPWSRVVYRPDSQRSGRPKVLFCTNFGTAYFWKLPREQADKLFAPWKDRIRIYSDYWRSIEAQWNSREHAFDFLNALVEADKYEILLRPHPMEETTIYEKWLNTLPPSRRQHIRMDATSNITPLILDCDLQISCETCTTALESWIAGKPTVELLFDRDQLWYFEEPARGNFPCDDPGRLVQFVEKGLREPLPPEMAEARRNHLEKWCSTPDGTSSEHIADIVAKALHGKEAADWSRLTVNDYRRSIKLQGLRSLGLAYHFDPLLPFKRTVFPSRYSVKDWTYKKSIKPRDVENARQRLESRLGS